MAFTEAVVDLWEVVTYVHDELGKIANKMVLVDASPMACSTYTNLLSLQASIHNRMAELDHKLPFFLQNVQQQQQPLPGQEGQ